VETCSTFENIVSSKYCYARMIWIGRYRISQEFTNFKRSFIYDTQFCLNSGYLHALNVTTVVDHVRIKIKYELPLPAWLIPTYHNSKPLLMRRYTTFTII